MNKLMCVYACTCMHMQAHVSLFMHVYVCTCISVCVNMCVFVSLNMFLFACFTNYNLSIVLLAMYKGEAYISTSLLLPPFSIQYVT